MSSNEEEYLIPLSLSKIEIKLLPWQQIITNGSLGSSPVVIEDQIDDASEDVGEPEECFSDGELSDTDRKEVHDGELELREYQRELAESALQGRNTIICAPTGSGKTRVATHIISEHLKVPDGRKRKVAFLARTVPLAVQQYKSLCKSLPNYEIMHITGEDNMSMSLHLFLPDTDIFVMTPMILMNHLDRNLLPNLGVFSLLVFDECHHTRKGEPYNALMSSYLKSKHYIIEANRIGKVLNITLPQIVGLTASVSVEGTTDPATAEEFILRLCGNLDVSSISIVEKNVAELTRTVPVPRELSKRLFKRNDSLAVLKINEIMHRFEKHIGEHIRVLNIPELNKLAASIRCDRKSQEYEQWAVLTKEAALVVPPSIGREKILSIRLIAKMAQYLTGYRFALETYDFVELENVMPYLEKCFQELQADENHTTEENTFYEYFTELKAFVQEDNCMENPNLQILVKTLMEHLLNKGQSSRGIIFVRTRALAEALASWLNRCEIQDIKNLNAHILTGSNISKEKGGTTQSQQESIIRDFLSGKFRLLVATSIAEEGIDIPECNLVIKYNKIGNEVSTVQTRGRSRAADGVSVLLGMDDVLEREHFNKVSAEVMWKAIVIVKAMTPADFKAAVLSHQQAIMDEILTAEQLVQQKRQQHLNVPFKIVCPYCRQVSIEHTSMRTIYEKYRVSIDRNVLNQIMIKPYSSHEPIDGLYFVGQAFCKGETAPGKICGHQLGVIVKHNKVPFLSVGIKNVAFLIGNQQEFTRKKQWSKVPVTIDELNYDEIIRYLKEAYRTQNMQVQAGNNEMDSEDDSTDDEN